MRIVIFGLSVSSTWGNGHGALWRGLIGALLRQGHRVAFFERDVPYYAEHRDLTALPDGGELVLYPSWADVRELARKRVRDSDVGVVTSYCADAMAAERLLSETVPPIRCFYDLDAPVTLARHARGEAVDYLGPHGLAGYDLVLSYTGGRTLDALRDVLGARRAVPIYGSVDPAQHHPAPSPAEPAALSYLGTYAEDRQHALERLFVEPARQLPQRRFVIGGAQYPPQFPWTRNIHFVRHLPPRQHPAFYASARLTLNVTRDAMARMGWCPPGRLFEAAACGVPIVSDAWEGLDAFFEPEREIIVARDTADVLGALALPDEALQRIAARARARTLEEHSADRRARELIAVLESSTLPQEA